MVFATLSWRPMWFGLRIQPNTKKKTIAMPMTPSMGNRSARVGREDDQRRSG